MISFKLIFLIVVVLYLTIPYSLGDEEEEARGSGSASGSGSDSKVTEKPGDSATESGDSGPKGGALTTKSGVGLVCPQLSYGLYGCLWSLLGLYYTMK